MHYTTGTLAAACKGDWSLEVVRHNGMIEIGETRSHQCQPTFVRVTSLQATVPLAKVFGVPVGLAAPCLMQTTVVKKYHCRDAVCVA